MFSAIVPSKRKLSCSTTPRCDAVVAEPEVSEVAAVDEDRPALRPVERHDEADQRALAGAARPTSAVVVPAGAVNDTFFSTGTPGVVFEGHVLERDVAVDVADRPRARVLIVLGRHRRDLADPVEAREGFTDLRADRRDGTTGAATSPVKKMYMTRSPSVIVPARIARPPTTIMSTPMMPTMAVAPRRPPRRRPSTGDIAEEPVRRPRVKTSASRGSAVYAFTMRMPPSVSASRPVTSALIFPARGRSDAGA